MGYPKFVIKTSAGQFYFHLADANGDIILHSERYPSRMSAERCIESVKMHSTVDQQYDRGLTQQWEHYFVLRGGNHEVIAMSQMYPTEREMEEGIVAVKRSAAVARVEAVPTSGVSGGLAAESSSG